MATRVELIGLRDSLITSRMNGIREFQDQNGERVMYRSDAEMKSAIEAVNRLIQDCDRRSPSTVIFRTSKGLDR